MFLYKDNRFHFNNISFCLPDNVYINTNCDEYKECIELIPNDENFRIIIYAEHSDRNAEQFFRKDEVEQCYCWIGDVTAIIIGNVNGYFCAYKSSYNSYTEYRFDTDGKNGNHVLGILIHRENSQEIEEVLTHSTIQNLLHSLKNE